MLKITYHMPPKRLSKWEAWNKTPPCPALSVYYIYTYHVFFFFFSERISYHCSTSPAKREEMTIQWQVKKENTKFLSVTRCLLIIFPYVWYLYIYSCVTYIYIRVAELPTKLHTPIIYSVKYCLKRQASILELLISNPESALNIFPNIKIHWYITIPVWVIHLVEEQGNHQLVAYLWEIKCLALLIVDYEFM